MKFLVLGHKNRNKLLRCLISICSNINRDFSIDILYNYANKEYFKKVLYIVQRFNPDITITVKRFNVHKRDRFLSEDILMLRKWINSNKIIDNEQVVICTENAIFTSTYIQDILSSVDFSDINMVTGEKPLEEIHGNGGCVYKSEILKKIPNMQWRNFLNINDLYLWYFREFCQSKKFFHNIIDAETNKKFYILKYNNVIID